MQLAVKMKEARDAKILAAHNAATEKHKEERRVKEYSGKMSKKEILEMTGADKGVGSGAGDLQIRPGPHPEVRVPGALQNLHQL